MSEFNLGAMIGRLVQGWKTLVAFAGILALAALAVLPTLRPIYSVHMLVMPAPTEQTASTNPSGSLSLLLGVVGGSAQGSNYTRYQNLISSNAVAQRMQDKYGMLQYVFRNAWDARIIDGSSSTHCGEI